MSLIAIFQIVWQCIIGLVLGCVGAVKVAGDFREIKAAAEMANKYRTIYCHTFKLFLLQLYIRATVLSQTNQLKLYINYYILISIVFCPVVCHCSLVQVRYCIISLNVFRL